MQRIISVQPSLLGLLVSYMTLALAAMLECSTSAVGDGRFGTIVDRFLRHAIALVHHCLRHDYVQGALTRGAQELSMQCRQLLDDAAAATARAPMRDRITGADAVGAVAATSNGRRCSRLFEARNCAACHAGGGNVVARGKTLDRAALTANNVDIETIVTMGKNQMPGFGQACCRRSRPARFGARLSDADIAEVRSGSTRAPTTGSGANNLVFALPGSIAGSMRRGSLARPLAPAPRARQAVTRSPAALRAPRRTSISASRFDTSSRSAAATPSSESGVSGVRGRGGGGGGGATARGTSCVGAAGGASASRASASAARSSAAAARRSAATARASAACALACRSTARASARRSARR